MKTAVSIPEAIFKAADRLAKRTKRSRSRLYALALEEYIRRHDPANVTASLSEAIQKYGQPADAAWLQAGVEQLRKVEW